MRIEDATPCVILDCVVSMPKVTYIYTVIKETWFALTIPVLNSATTIIPFLMLLSLGVDDLRYL